MADKGYFVERTKIIHHDAVAGVPDQSHIEVVKVYPNGGKDTRKIIDVPAVEAKPAWDEEITEKVFVPYSQKELDQQRITELKQLLANSDYKAIKYAEGLISASDYAPVKAMRESYRAEINMLEAKTY